MMANISKEMYGKKFLKTLYKTNNRCDLAPNGFPYKEQYNDIGQKTI